MEENSAYFHKPASTLPCVTDYTILASATHFRGIYGGMMIPEPGLFFIENVLDMLLKVHCSIYQILLHSTVLHPLFLVFCKKVFDFYAKSFFI